MGAVKIRNSHAPVKFGRTLPRAYDDHVALAIYPHSPSNKASAATLITSGKHCSAADLPTKVAPHSSVASTLPDNK